MRCVELGSRGWLPDPTIVQSSEEGEEIDCDPGRCASTPCLVVRRSPATRPGEYERLEEGREAGESKELTEAREGVI